MSGAQDENHTVLECGLNVGFSVSGRVPEFSLGGQLLCRADIIVLSTYFSKKETRFPRAALASGGCLSNAKNVKFKANQLKMKRSY